MEITVGSNTVARTRNIAMKETEPLMGEFQQERERDYQGTRMKISDNAVLSIK